MLAAGQLGRDVRAERGLAHAAARVEEDALLLGQEVGDQPLGLALLEVLAEAVGLVLLRVQVGPGDVLDALRPGPCRGGGRGAGATEMPVAPFPPFEPFVRLYRDGLNAGIGAGTLAAYAIVATADQKAGWWLAWPAAVGWWLWAWRGGEKRAEKWREGTLSGEFERRPKASPCEPIRLYKLCGRDVLDFQAKEAQRRPEEVECLQIMLEGGSNAYQHEYLTGKRDVSEATIQYLLMAGLIEVERLDEWGQDEDDAEGEGQ